MKPLLTMVAAALISPVWASVTIYSAPEEETLSTQYEVRIDGRSVPVYGARVLDAPFAGKEWDYGGPYSFANFDTDGPVQITITGKVPMRNVIVRPAREGIVTEVKDEHTLTLTLPGPCKISVEPDGKKGPLLLFANPAEQETPKPGPGSGLFQQGRAYRGPDRSDEWPDPLPGRRSGRQRGIVAMGDNIRSQAGGFWTARITNGAKGRRRT